MQTERETAVIRQACAGDVAAMADLLGQLGYPVSPQELEDRWLTPDPAREVLVACLDERIAGVLVWHCLNPLHVAPEWGLMSMGVQGEAAWGPPCWPWQRAMHRRGGAASWSSPAASSGKGPIASIWRRGMSSVRNGL